MKKGNVNFLFQCIYIILLLHFNKHTLFHYHTYMQLRAIYKYLNFQKKFIFWD